MKAEQILMGDLGLDAIKYMEAVFHRLSDDVQTKVMAGVIAGGQFEVRIRMKASQAPRFSLVLVGKNGELELHCMGGAK